MTRRPTRARRPPDQRRTEFHGLTQACETCGATFVGTRIRRFCSSACRHRFDRLTRIAEWTFLRSRIDDLIRRG